MDPITQGAFGASWALNSKKKTNKRSIIFRTFLFGWLAGMAPDIDIFIRSNVDPLLYLEYHRQFTHSLIFIPVGALICCGLFNAVFNWIPKFPKRESFKVDYLVCLFGFASHGVLDSATSYGTQLLWPFTNARISWNLISIIDPIFTIPLLIGIILTIVLRNQKWIKVALIFGFMYLLLGLIQNNRAMNEARALAEQRGHTPEMLSVKPAIANMILWKSVYAFEDKYYVDAVRVGFNSKVYEGDTTQRFTLEELQEMAGDSEVQRDDIKRFHWFSQSYVSVDKDDPNYIVDLRYSMLPNEVDALWGIVIERDRPGHVGYDERRERSPEAVSKLMKMLKGEDL